MNMDMESAEAELAKLRDHISTKPPTIAGKKMFDAIQAVLQERLRLQAIVAELPKTGPAIVCLCGSTRFMDAFHEAGWQLTLDGYIVLTVGVCKHAADHGGEALGQDVADRLDELHFRKIDLCEWVFVLNVNGYVGESTRKEIEYATEQGKRITYLEPEAAASSKGGRERR